MFEYRLNFCRSVTATLRGAFGVGIVVVGPLKQALAEESASIVESGMYVGSFLPFFSHCSEPASAIIISEEKPHSESIPSIESTDSGPIPSPFITTAVFPNMS